MSETLENKAVEVIDKAMDGMDQLTVMLAGVADKYGAEVVDAGLAVARISAASNLIYAFVGWLMFIGILKLLWYGAMKYRMTFDECDKNDGDFWGPVLLSSVGIGVFTLIVCFMELGAFNILNLWNWVGVVEPKLWIAHQVLKW